MKENNSISQKAYTVSILLNAVNEAKARNYDEAMKVCVIAVAGAAVCLESGDLSCLNLLDDIIKFMDSTVRFHPNHVLREQRMIDALSIALSSLNKPTIINDSAAQNAKVRYLYRAIISYEQLGQKEEAIENTKKAFELIRLLRKQHAVTCWFEISLLYMHRGKQHTTRNSPALSIRYVTRAFNSALTGCKTNNIQYRNKCYRQMMKCCCILIHSYYNQSKKFTSIKWILLLFFSFIVWGISKFLLDALAFIKNIGLFIRRILTKYGWRILQVLYIGWLFWLLQIIINLVFH